MVVAGSSLILALALVPLVRKLSFQFGKVSIPRDDRWHQKPTPVLGGIAIYASFLAGILLSAAINRTWEQLPWGIIIGGSMIFAVGLYDDFKPLTPPAKLVGQLLAVLTVIFLGYTTNFFTPRISNSLIAQIPNIALTLLWLIGITNAINLLDNMDGLAGGISLVAAGFLGVLFLRGGDVGLVTVAVALSGAILGFLVYNFPPASIFMGDSGSLFLGFTLAVLAIARQPQASNVFAVMGVPTLLFMLPILDTTLVTITRLLRGQSPSRGGRDHTSHRLIAFGLTERQAVLALYVLALMSGLAGLILETIDYWLSLMLVPLIVLVFAIFAAYLGRLKVVVTEKHSEPGALSRMLVELTYRRRLLEIALDLLLISIAFYMAFLVYQGFHMSDAYLELFQRTLPLAISVAYISFFGFGVYRGVWRYVGLDDLIRFIKSIAGTVALLFLVDSIFLRGEDLPLSIYLFYAVFLFLGLSTTRSSFKLLDQASSQQRSMKEERVLIYGAGDAGEMAARWILMKPELGFHTIGFIDDDLLISGRQIHGIEILGGHEIIFDLLENNKVDGVVITSDAAHPKEVMELFRERGKWIRTFQLEFKLLE